MANPETDGLKIGDLITLRSPKWERFLGAEGILLDDLIVKEALKEFDDCIFSVHLQRQYSASRELESFLETYYVDENAIKDEGMKQYLKALQKGRDNEVKLNNMYMKNKVGLPVGFGDVIQLYHVKSKKYLIVNPKILANAERENSKVSLSTSGNVHSWVQFMPRFKIDREGDRILTSSELFIRIAERPNEFVHCAEKSPKDGFAREVNCSLENTSFKLTIFQDCGDAVDNTIVLASSQLVYIHDAETRSNITIAQKSLETLDEKPSASVGISDEIEGGEEHIHIYGDIVLQPMSDQVDSRSVWTLEKTQLVKGGAIHWKSSHIRFKNIATSLYLQHKIERGVDEDGVVGDKTIFTYTENREDAGTQFHFFESNSSNKNLSKGKAIQIGCSGQWLCRGEHVDLNFMVKSVSDKSQAVNLLVQEYKQFVPEDEEEDEDSTNPLDMYSGLAICSYLKKYFGMTEIPENRSVNTLWPTAERTDVAFYQEVVTKAKNFAQGFLISNENISLGVDKSNPLLREQRQTLVRELGVLEQAMRLINKLKPITDMYDKSVKSKNSLLESEQSVLRFGNMLLNQSLDLVYYCILDCPDNQMYVADFLPDLLAHLSSQPLAGKCVTAMLSTNMELQETKIGSREISIFVDKLRSSKMNSMYLNLLQSCCSCQGQGVDANQCRVADMLFENTNDIIISLIVDFNKTNPVDWGESIYIPSGQVLGSPVEGQVLLDKGLPELALSWTTNAIDFSPLGLFGKLSVNVADLYKNIPKETKAIDTDISPEKAAAIKKSKAKAEAVLKQKSAIANYFIQEMYLGAEMCMDRNYVAMHKLDPLFSFESLVTIMKMNINNKIKASACRLLFCLHVDRDPQVGTKIPCLTRTWSDIVKYSIPQLPYVSSDRENVYALIQQLCSEHVRGMSGHRWDELSKYNLQMLLGLLKFNFYGTIEKMKDVIEPIISAVDRRKVDFGGKKKTEACNDETDATVEVDHEELEKERIALEIKNSWQKRQYDFLEGLPAMCAILVLVLLAVAVTIYQVVSGVDETTEFFIFGLVVLAIFLYDFFMRFYCYYHINGAVTPFLKDTFNIIDQIVILIDIVFLVLPSDVGGSGTSFTKTLRLIRLVRLVRVLRAAKVINAFTKQKKEVVKWNAPARYTKCPTFELETMTEAINILMFVQGVIEDRNLSLLLRYFWAWESGQDDRTPGEIFSQVVEDSVQLTLGIEDFDEVFVDAIMFKYSPLVQGALNVLMARHSMRETLLKNAAQVQLLVSPKRERQFRLISATVQQLERNAETHELWGELETDLDHATNKQTKEILLELVDLCRTPADKLEFNFNYAADTQIQDLLRNLGLFEIALKVLGLLDSVAEDEDGELGEVALNTRELCLTCNELLYWFTIGNPQNQEIVFEELEFFLGSLDDEIKSHKIVRAIFKDNESLMKIVPHSLLSDMADKICQEGKSHHYLALAASITHVGEKNIVKNQFEIIKSLCGPSRLSKVSCWLVPIDHPDYQEKIGEMAKHTDVHDDDLDNLPPLLAYHLAFLEVLSNCTIGRINITSIEAKVQSIYGCIDIVNAIMDPECSLIAKKYLTLHLFNAIIEVEIMIPGLEKSKVIWNLLCAYEKELSNLTANCKDLDEQNWRSEKVARGELEYQLSCIMNIGGFFARYYDPAALGSQDEVVGDNADITDMDVEGANDLMGKLYGYLYEFYKYNSAHLTETQKGHVFDALEALNKSAKTPFYQDIVKIHLLENEISEEDEFIAHDVAHEMKVHEKYEEFLQALKDDETVQEAANDENKEFISVIEDLPYLIDTRDSEIRFEPFIQKLVNHVRQNMAVIDGERRINSECTSTTTWIIKAFRTMIENQMGMTIYDRDEDGGEEEDIKAGPIVTALNENGVTGLCLDLIAIGIDEELQSEVIKLMVGMLFKEGGAREVQDSVHSYLTKNQSELFFKQVRMTIQKLIAWHKWNEVIILEEGKDPDPPEDILIIRFLQLLAEGHFLPNQEIIREQPHNHVSINLLDDFVNYFNAVSRLPCQTSTDAAIRVGATIVEVIQGPCTGNQTHFALSTDLLEIQNRIMRAKVVNDCIEDAEIELKKTCLDTISALLEGQTPKDQVTERILSVLHLDIIIMLSKPSEFDDEPEEEASEERESLQTDCQVLLQMLCDYKPAIRDEMEAEGGPDMDGTTTASVEVSWDGILNRRFFHVPDVCNLLAKSSKDRLVQEIDRSNPENKLIDFLARAQGLYREIKHQEFLTEMGVSLIFSRTNQDRATNFTFVLAATINTLMVYGYTAKNGDPVMPDNIVQAVAILNYIQIFVASFTMVLTFAVRSPVIAKGFQESETEYNGIMVLIYTAMDPMTMYYMTYLIIAIMSTVMADYYSCLLLLDIVVKDVTTADVLNAVVQPRVQLGYALLLGLFVCYIFAFYTFLFYRYDVDSGDLKPFCETLYDCTKFCISYGLQNGGGISDNMYHGKDQRLILDLAWFIVVLVVFINIIFGIVIDTFSSLRAEKNAKAMDTTESCFICSIGRVTFDRASDAPDGFKNHIMTDHHMWSYLNFIFFLWEQDKDDDDGLEYYVRHKIMKNEITWFPMHKAMCLNQEMTKSEALTEDLSNSVVNSQKEMSSKLLDYQASVKHLLDSLTETLQDPTFLNTEVEGEETAEGKTKTEGEEEGEWIPSWGYNASIEVSEVRGIDLSLEELLQLNYRLIADAGMYSAAAIDAKAENCIAIFESHDPYLVGEGCQLNDPNTIQFQILQRGGAGVAKFVAVIELQLAELMAGESGAIVEKSFTRSGQVEPCHIMLKGTYVKANFMKLGGDDDYESDAD